MSSKINYNPIPVQTDALQRAFFSSSMRKLQKDRSKIYKKITVNSALFSMPEDCVYGQINDARFYGNTRNNLIKSSNMDKDSNADGVVDEFSYTQTATGLTTAKLVDSNAQKIDVTASTNSGFARIIQTVEGLNAGETISFRVEVKSALNGTAKARIMYQFKDSANANVGVAVTNDYTTLSSFTEKKFENIPVPATATKIELTFGNLISASGDTGTVWFKNAMLEKASTVGNYITSGVKSTNSVRLKAINPQNIFDGLIETGYAINQTTGQKEVNAITNCSKTFTRIVSGKTYFISKNNAAFADNKIRLFYYNSNKVYISNQLIVGSKFTSAVDGYLMFQGGNTDVEVAAQYQIAESAVLTPYVPYKDTTIYTPADMILRKVGVANDEYRGDGTKIQNVSDSYLLQATDITSLDTGSFAGIDVYFTKIFSNQKILSGGSSTLGHFIVGTLTEFAYSSRASITIATGNPDQYYFNGEGILMIATSKGKYASLAAAKTGLSGTSVNYQLATPVYTYYDPKTLGDDLEVGPGYILMIEAACYGIQKPIFGTGKIMVTTSDKAIKEIVKVIRIDENSKGQLIRVDVTSSATITDSGTSITISGADPTKNYFYDCNYIDGISTVPTVVIDYPVGEDQSGSVVTHDYGAAALAWTLSGDEARATMLICTNAGGAANIIGPNNPGRFYIVKNTSGQAITIKTSSGTGVAIATGKTAVVVNAGTDYVRVTADN